MLTVKKWSKMLKHVQNIQVKVYDVKFMTLFAPVWQRAFQRARFQFRVVAPLGHQCRSSATGLSTSTALYLQLQEAVFSAHADQYG